MGIFSLSGNIYHHLDIYRVLYGYDARVQCDIVSRGYDAQMQWDIESL